MNETDTINLARIATAFERIAAVLEALLELARKADAE